MTRPQRVMLALRVSMEIGIVAALATWGVHVADGAVAQVALGVLGPAVGFGFWGAVDFHQAGHLAEPLRLAQELAVSGLAAAAWYVSGYPGLAAGLAATSIAYHVAVYATGNRLLKQA